MPPRRERPKGPPTLIWLAVWRQARMRATTLWMWLWVLAFPALAAPLIARQTAPPGPCARATPANEPAAATQDFRFSPAIAEIRQVATMIPGDRALRINVLK